MKHLIVIILIIEAMMGSTIAQCPSCMNAGAGSVPLSPLSYNTVRSNVFNGTQPSNEGCTNGATVNGQMTINCGQGTTLTDCDRGLTNDNPDYSDLSNTFAWNRTTSVTEQVSIVFRFYQQINISRITMFFWNSQNNSIIVPNVRMFWSNDDSITPTNEISFTLLGGSPRRTDDGRRRLNFNGSNAGVQLQYLRIVMTFYDLNEWIFLGDVFFCGNTAPFHITDPSTDNDVQIVSSTATMASVMCSLNVTIPSSMVVLWTRNANLIIDRSQVTTTGNTTTLVIRNPQPSDAGVYQCELNDKLGSGWVLRRNIRLFITDSQIIQPADDFNVITFDESTSLVQLMCSLNVPIPSSVTVIWTHNSNLLTITPSNEVTTTGNTTTLVIRHLQPSDAGDYQCVFNGLNLGRFIRLVFMNVTATTITAVTTTITTTTITTTATTLVTTSATVDTITATGVAASIPVVASATTTATITAAITTTIITTTTAAANADVTTSSNESTNTGAIVAIIVVVVILLIAIVVTVLILVFYWRKKQKQYHIYDDATELNTRSPSYASAKQKEIAYTDGKPLTKNTESLPSIYAIPEKRDRKEKRGSMDLSKRRSIEFNYKPQRSPEMPVRSRKQTVSLISRDYDEVVDFDIYAATAPKIPERTEASRQMVNDDREEAPIYSEAISPTAIETTSSHDYSSVNDNLYPYTSIYADPLPLVKSEGPPIVYSRNIKPLHQLGVGQFGEVILANTVGLSYQDLGIGNSNDSTISMKVAVKTLKASHSEDVRKSFEKEIKFMSRLKDDNVIRLLGICTTGTPFIMMEYMENGDLNNYLQKFDFTHETEKQPAANEITLNALVYISFQVASGMKYLSSCKFIHRDLAARNILVGTDYVVKIADFGMSQNLYSAYYCKVGGCRVLPIRWMACECFYGKFSVQTDVWAFGITLWEIFTLCRERPFEHLSDNEMINNAVQGPSRSLPEQPEICPDDIYYVMKSCWRHEPSERARFSVLCDQLNEYYSNIL